VTTQTGLIGGAAVSRSDESIKRELSLHGTRHPGCSLRLGIRNEAGIVYRWARTFGIQHFTEVLIAMAGLGFVDELADAAIPCEGFDAILAPDANRFISDPEIQGRHFLQEQAWRPQGWPARLAA